MAAAVRPLGFLAQFHNSLKRFVFRASGFNQLGLYHDDCLYETSDVQEALRRTPQVVLDERNFRMQRALQLSMTKTILPKDQWVSFEEVSTFIRALQDRERGRYLQPYLEEVVRERKEREEWNKK